MLAQHTLSTFGLGRRTATSWDLLALLQRHAWAVIGAALIVYSLAFAAFYPDVITVKDESRYVHQARFYAAGITSDVREEAFTGEMVETRPGTYPFGTSTLMAPLVAMFGWRGVYGVPWIALLLGVLLTARWIADEGRSSLAALVIMGFPAALVMGRTAMSDVPSLALVSAGLLFFWRGLDRGAAWSLASGVCAGLSLTVREPNVLVFAPFYAGALVRRDRNVGALILGGLIGTAARPIGNWIIFGDPFFARASAGFFDPEALPVNLTKHLLALMVLVPGGLVAGLLYRGRRAVEVRTCVALFVGFYLVYNYSGAPSGWLKGTILGQRFFLPLLPVLAFALADFVPRLWRQISERGRHAWMRPLAGFLVAGWVIGIIGVSAGVHAYMSNWSRSQTALRNHIEAYVEFDKPLVANLNLTEKVIDRFDFKYVPVDREYVDLGSLMTLADRHDHFYVVLIDRAETHHFRKDSRRNEALLASLDGHVELLLEERTSPTERIRILRVAQRDAAMEPEIAFGPQMRPQDSLL